MKRLITLLLILPIVKCSLSQSYSAGSNIIGMVTGSLNLELSAGLNRRLSVHLPISWNPFHFGENRKILHMALQPGLRFWSWHSYSGFYTGAQLGFIRYNCGLNTIRYDGKGYGCSLSAGYSKMVSGRWNLDFEVGAGIFRLVHDCFERKFCGEYLYSEDKLKLLPCRLSVNLVYLF
ncbi:MAG: DUF3575 domain-containing protein [Bacteroidales bacterium]